MNFLEILKEENNFSLDLVKKLLKYKRELFSKGLELSKQEIIEINSVPKNLPIKSFIYRGFSSKKDYKIGQEIFIKSKYKYIAFTFDKDIAKFIGYSYADKGDIIYIVEKERPNNLIYIDNYLTYIIKNKFFPNYKIKADTNTIENEVLLEGKIKVKVINKYLR